MAAKHPSAASLWEAQKCFAGQHFQKMSILKWTCSALDFLSLPTENRQLHLDFTPRLAVKQPSAALPWEAQKTLLANIWRT